MLRTLQPDMRELLDLVRDEASYRATLAARPDIKAEPVAEVEYARRDRLTQAAGFHRPKARMHSEQSKYL